MKQNLKGFTLIELLIVVAIIAILAAIAVPNFLEAQTRSKVSRVKADLRTTTTALEAYFVDNQAYPQCHPFGIAGSNFGWNPAATTPPTADTNGILERLSTPIAYITTALTTDVFSVKFRYSAATALALSQSTRIPVPSTDAAGRLNSYIYQSWNHQDRATVNTNRKAIQWLLHSAGPDNAYHNLGGVLANDLTMDGPINLIYDPTNGTISFGSIYRAGGSQAGSPTYAGGRGLVQAIQTQR